MSDNTSSRIEEGVMVEFLPEEWKDIKYTILKNQETINLIMQLGSELAKQEQEFWAKVYRYYPEAEKYRCQVDMVNGILYVNEPAGDSTENNLPPPFSRAMRNGEIVHDRPMVKMGTLDKEGLQGLLSFLARGIEEGE